MFVPEEEPKRFYVGIGSKGSQGKQGLLIGLLGRGQGQRFPCCDLMASLFS